MARRGAGSCSLACIQEGVDDVDGDSVSALAAIHKPDGTVTVTSGIDNRASAETSFQKENKNHRLTALTWMEMSDFVTMLIVVRQVYVAVNCLLVAGILLGAEGFELKQSRKAAQGKARKYRVVEEASGEAETACMGLRSANTLRTRSPPSDVAFWDSMIPWKEGTPRHTTAGQAVRAMCMLGCWSVCQAFVR